jgi:SAM-dependent methyltransferase
MEPLLQRRFRSASKYYLSGRPSYSSLLIRRVVELCALNSTHKILDLGSGPGQLAMAFAPLVREVTALDPEPEMLEIGRKIHPQAISKLNLFKGVPMTLARSTAGFKRPQLVVRSIGWIGLRP